MESLICSLFRGSVAATVGSGRKGSYPKKSRQLPKNLRYRRRTEILPDYGPVLRRADEPNSFERRAPDSNYSPGSDCSADQGDDVDAPAADDDGEIIAWEAEEIEAISSLFQARVPQKPGKKLSRERPLPLPLPHKIRPLGLPTSKNLVRTHLSRSQRQPISNQIYKNPAFLIRLAREIRSLSPDDDVSKVLTRWAPFLRKGSLSITVRELGHMGLSQRALHVFCWVQDHPHLYPDDRILASTVQVLSAARELKMSFDLNRLIALASRSVYEALVKGSIDGGNLGLAYRILSAATEGKRTLDCGVYAKLILELGKIPDKAELVLPLLEELAKRDDFELTQQDCTGIMKVCIRMGRFDIVEALYDWFRNSGTAPPSVVMYTTLIHSRYTEEKHREAMAVVWEMEASDCLLDLPAYRVLIKLFVALNDLPRTVRYFAKMKENGFRPTFDIYRNVIGIYRDTGRLAKCRQICREAEMAGFKF